MRCTLLFPCAFVVVSLAPALAFAQDPPAGTGTGVAQASSGSSELEGQGSFQTAAEPAEGDDATELTTSAGGILSTGNANQAAVTGALNFRLRRGDHQFSSIAMGNYGASKLEKENPFETTVKNIQGRVRYDYFFAKRWSAFGMLTARHDPFQQLKLRMNVDPGVAFYILPEADHRLWTELGYDFQYDLRTPEGYATKNEAGEFIDAEGNVVESVDDAALDNAEKTATNHAARLFLGYSNHISDSVTFDTGIEYLQSVLLAKTLRVNYDAGLTAALGQKFSISTTFTLRFDNNPLEGVEKLDTVTAVNLTYRFL
jgi:putative salt-induced outer membrane protein